MTAAARALGADRLAQASESLDRAGRLKDAESMHAAVPAWRAAWAEVEAHLADMDWGAS